MASAASVIVQLLADTTDFERKFGGAAGRISSLGQNLTGAGTALTAGLTVPLVGVGAVAARTAADFEAQMNILQTAAGQSGLSLEELSAAALAVGGDTHLVGIDASQAAEALTGLYKAGLDTGDIFGDLNGYLNEGAELSGALRAAVDLQAASELDLATASDVVAVAMATFGLSAEEATHIADNFVQTADTSVASVPELADALANVGPSARAFGLSLEETNLALGLLSERGIRGAEAGTALKSMLVNMSRDTAEVRQAWEALGISLYDSGGQMRSLPVVIAELEQALAGMTEEQRNQYVQTLAGSYGMNALNTLLAEGSAGWAEMATQVRSAAGAQSVAQARTRGFRGAMEALRGSAETFLIRAATPLLERFLTPAVQKLTALIDRLGRADPRLVQIGVAAAGAVAAAGPLLLILGALISSIGRLVGLAEMLKAGLAAGSAAIAALGVPVAPLIAVLLGLVAVVALVAAAWRGNWAGIRDWVARAWQTIQTVIQTAIAVIQPVIAEFLATVRRVFAEQGPALMARFQGLWVALAPVISTVLKIIGAALTVLLGVAVGVVTGIMRGLNSLISMFLTVLGAVIEVATGIIQTVRGLFEVVIGLVTGDSERVRAGFERMGDGARQIIEGLKTTVIALFRGLANTVWAIVSGFVDGVVNFFTGLYQKLVGGSIVPDMVTGILSWFTRLRERALALFTGLLSAATEIWNTVRSTIAAKAQQIKTTVTSRITETAASWSNRWREMRAGVSARLGEMVSNVAAQVANLRATFFSVDWAAVGSSIISRVRDGVMRVAASLASAAASVVSAAISAARTAFGGASAAAQSYTPAYGYQGGATYREDFGRPGQTVVNNTNARNVSVTTNRTTHRGFIE